MFSRLMAGTSKKNRLSPPLMFAFRSAHAEHDAKKKFDLRDEAGERIIAGRRASVRIPITETTLRREVSHDLDALMNTIALESSEDLEAFPAVRNSIINYGFPDIAHRSIDELSVDHITDELKSVLMNYEPRLLPETIQVARDMGANIDELKIRFVVRADLFCEPLNVPVEFVADLELDSGQIAIDRL
jgi:type VI secretion system protein ImpF